MRYMFANHPKMAKEWAEHTKDMESLPEKKMTGRGRGIKNKLNAIAKRTFFPERYG